MQASAGIQLQEQTVGDGQSDSGSEAGDGDGAAGHQADDEAGGNGSDVEGDGESDCAGADNADADGESGSGGDSDGSSLSGVGDGADLRLSGKDIISKLTAALVETNQRIVVLQGQQEKLEDELQDLRDIQHEKSVSGT